MNKSRKLERIRKWIDGKPAVLVNTALFAVNSIEEITWLLQYDIKQKEAKNKIALPNPDCWLNFYKRSFWIQSVGACVMCGYPRGVKYALLLRTFRSMAISAQRDPEKFKETIIKKIKTIGEQKMARRLNTCGKLMTKAISHDLEQELNGLLEPPKPMAAQEASEFDKLMRSQEMAFYIRVWLPCFVLHHTEPAFMMMKARQGDMQSLENLLRIDKMVLFEPKIRDQYIHAKYIPRKGMLGRISKAFNGRPIGGISRKKIKKHIAQFVHQMFSAVDVNLSVADVQEFFDALAAAKGLLRDEDIVSQEALKKALERNQPWPAFSRTKIK